MTSYRYLGYGVTNSNGVAHLDHDPQGNPINGYTGTGAGEVDVIASTDNPISSGSIVSEPYNVWDTIFYDDGLSGTQTKWDTIVVSKSLESNGTKFLVTDTSASARASTNPVDNASAYDYQPQPMAFECYVVDLYRPSGSGALGIQFIQQNPVINKQILLLGSDIGHTVKVLYTGTALEVYVDGVHQSSRDLEVTFGNSELMRVGFAFYSKDNYVVVKNVKTYLI